MTGAIQVVALAGVICASLGLGMHVQKNLDAYVAGRVYLVLSAITWTLVAVGVVLIVARVVSE